MYEGGKLTISPRKRIHEVTYAQKVVAKNKPDKANIRLNESLFHAQYVAKKSSTLIKDIQRDVQFTLRKYDDYVKLSESNRKLSDRQFSERKTINQTPILLNSQSERQLDQLREQQKVLLGLLVNMQQQEQILLNSSPPKLIETSWYEQKGKMLNSMTNKKDIFMAENLSPIKKANQSRQSTVTIDLSKTKKQVQAFDFQQGSYAKIHRKKSIRRSPDVCQRNQEWKCRVEEKIKSEQKKKEELEMRNCTFRPKILDKSPTRRYSNSKEYSKDLGEIMFLIDDLNDFNKKLKKSDKK